MAKKRFDISEYNNSLTPEERTERARQAARANVAKQRQRKTMRDGLKAALQLDVNDVQKKHVLEALGLAPTMQNAILLSAMIKAQDGDIEAARFVRDTVGEKPTEQYNLGVLDRPVKSIDLTGLSDAELEALADAEDAEL